MSPTESYEISAAELSRLMQSGEPVLLLDCRETWEHAAASISPSENIPMNTIPANINRIEALAEGKRLVVYCHHGVRSLNTVAWLRRQGLEEAQSLAGGIDRWSLEIDPTVPRY